MALDTSSLRGAITKGFWRIRMDVIQVFQDTAVLAAVAADGDDDGKAPENARDQ